MSRLQRAPWRIDPGRVPQYSKQMYASAASSTGAILTRIGVMPLEAPPRSSRWKHWAFSLTRIHDSLGLASLGVPWWTYRAIDAVDAWLEARPGPTRVFEYGSGASTLWLADRADEVTSIEHHTGFAQLIGPVLANCKNVTFQLVEPKTASHPQVPSKKPGHGNLDFADYVRQIDDVGGTFDLIVIDGRARGACLERATHHLASDGLIILDNSLRRRYRKAIRASGLAERRLPGLTPTLPYPDSTSLLSPVGRPDSLR